VRVNKKRKV